MTLEFQSIMVDKALWSSSVRKKGTREWFVHVVWVRKQKTAAGLEPCKNTQMSNHRGELCLGSTC